MSLAALLLVLQTSGNLSGQVVTVDGNPAGGAVVGTTFALSQFEVPKVQIGYGEPGIRTDQNGRFTIAKSSIYNGALVASFENKTVGFTTISNIATDVRIIVRPTTNVALNAQKTLQKSTEGVNYSLGAGSSVIGYLAGNWGITKAILPTGTLDLTAYESQSQNLTRKINLVPGKEFRLVISLKPAKWVEWVGKPAPAWTFTDISPKGRALTAKTLRGKWVLVDFWATWCQPCVQEFPAVSAFYIKNKSRLNKFEIIAVHSPDGKSFEAIQPAFQSLIKTSWKGKTPPFPFAFDKSGTIHKRYGVEVYPSRFLIDPNGIFVGPATLVDLEKKLNSSGPAS